MSKILYREKCNSIILKYNWLKEVISFKKIFNKRIILFLYSIISVAAIAQAQNLIIQDVVMGCTEVSASSSITMKTGFSAVIGSTFRAFIGPDNVITNSSSVSGITSSSPQVNGSTSINSIITTVLREPISGIVSGSFKNQQNIQYFDGLGRLTQSIDVGASPLGNDIIHPVSYDEYGREYMKMLPYTLTKSGAFQTGDLTGTVNSYYNGSALIGKVPDNVANSKTVYDNSPLDRVLTETGPGSAWASKPKTINYLINDAPKTTLTVSSSGVFTTANFPTGSLYVNEVIDEQGNTTREYRDKLDRVVLKENKLGAVWLQTFYIYDDFGLLRCVIPPQATSPSDINLCYFYNYDNRSRLIEKKIPDAGTTKIIYDDRNRVRCTQNSLQATSNEWSFTKYDQFNRPVITGIIKNLSSTISAIQSLIDGSSINELQTNTTTYYGYNNASFPGVSQTTVISTVNYYDNYNFYSVFTNFSDSLKSTKYTDVYGFNNLIVSSLKGKITGTYTGTLSSDEDNTAIYKKNIISTFFYDKYGRLLRNISENIFGGKDVFSNKYEDITNLILSTKQEHYKGSEKISIVKNFEYDQVGRLLATRQIINNQPEITMSAMEYNEIGEMVNKYLYSNQTSGIRNYVQKTKYQYSIRGWLTKINDPTLSGGNDVFGMQLCYNDVSGLGSFAPSVGLFNGNIAGLMWKEKGDTLRGYKFTYDGLNRILQSNYGQGDALNKNLDYYSEIITSAQGAYDKNGNILGLQRKFNNVLVDNLAYSYVSKSNQLQNITDTGITSSAVADFPGTSANYAFDVNGNLANDGAKNLTVNYFSTLNLPQRVDFGNNNKIYYHYTATGNKLLKHTTKGSYTYYIGNIIYQDGKISSIISDEGRLIPIGEGANRTFQYEYNIKDHLGNTRVTFMGVNLGGAVDIVQSSNYYPFGLVMSQFNGNTSVNYNKNKYLYNGKELQNDNFTGEAFNWYDYGARFYDPQIGRWNRIDPLAEKYRRWSPYNYGVDNPVRFIDPDGMGILDGIVDELANRAKAYVAQKANELVTNVAKAVVQVAKNELKKWTPSFYAEGSVKVEAGKRVTAEVKGVGVDKGKSSEALSIGFSSDKNGTKGSITGELSAKRTMTDVTKVGVPVPVGDAVVTVEGSHKTTQTTDSSDNSTSTSTENSVSAGVPLLNVQASSETETNTNEPGTSTTTNKVGLSTGWGFMVGLGIHVDLSAGLKFTKKEE